VSNIYVIGSCIKWPVHRENKNRFVQESVSQKVQTGGGGECDRRRFVRAKETSSWPGKHAATRNWSFSVSRFELGIIRDLCDVARQQVAYTSAGLVTFEVTGCW